jgi:NAD(P)-dependent dehydrogenase (short-subunit alcohol dehydrogenase family)
MPSADGGAPLAIVTGATSGFGLAACEQLLARGVDVILAVRSASSGAAVAAGMAARARAGAGAARVMALDLSDLASVASFAAAVAALDRPLAFLILNAGMVSLGGARALTAQGFEATVGVNHLGHAALFNLLLPRLKASRTRVVAVGSTAHASGKLAAGAPLDAAAGLQAYANSKLLNTVWGFEVQRRFAADGVTCNSVHPGSGLSTGLGLGAGSTLAAALRYTLIPLATPLMCTSRQTQKAPPLRSQPPTPQRAASTFPAARQRWPALLQEMRTWARTCGWRRSDCCATPRARTACRQRSRCSLEKPWQAARDPSLRGLLQAASMHAACEVRKLFNRCRGRRAFNRRPTTRRVERLESHSRRPMTEHDDS